MALSTANDYKTALYKILRVAAFDIDIQTWIRAGGISSADAHQILSEYHTYISTLTSRVDGPKSTTTH